MVTKSFLFFLSALSFFLVSCKSAQKPIGSGTAVGSRPEAIPQAVGASSTSNDQQRQVEQSTLKSEPKKVAVILGPGGAKAFANLGVLKAFQQQRIPVDKVIGLEWGALIAGLYSLKGQTHDVEWKLYKMDQQKLFDTKSFFGGKSTEVSYGAVEGFLKESFGAEDIGRAKVEFSCPTRSVMSGSVAWQSKGSFVEALRRCLPFPPTFKVQGASIAGPSQSIDAVDLLVRQGFNVIILVNPLGNALPMGQEALRENLNYVILWQEIRRALLETARLNIDTVNVDTSHFPMNQFSNQKELISLGEAAGLKASTVLIEKYGF